MTEQVEKPSDLGSTPQAVVTRWLKELSAAEKNEQDWHDRREKITKRYRDERDQREKKDKRYNILFANTEVLFGVLYQRPPTPDVRRRFRDEDVLGRVTADILSRALSYCIDSYDLDSVLKDCTKDYLLGGRTVARVKYKPTIEKVDQPDPIDPTKTTQVEQVVYEEAPAVYIEPGMFRYSPAKRWDKVRWVAFGELMTRDDLIKNFGDELGNDVKLTWCPTEHTDKGDGEDNIYRRALVWVIWNKTDRKVYAVTDGYKDQPLATEDDPLKLEDFFPCKKPLQSVWTPDSLIPIPEYSQYEDQALELDEITERRNALIQMLRWRGVRDGSIEELSGLAKAKDGTFVPVMNMALLTEKGGLSKAFEAISNEDIAAVVELLFEKQQDLKQSIYEITGISDIVRGASDAKETATAQQIKAQYSNVRIAPRQKDVANFARDLLRMKAEIIAEHFSAQTLQLMTGVKLPSKEDKDLAIQQAQQQMQAQAMQAQQSGQQVQPDATALQKAQAMITWDDVMGLLRNEKLRSFRIDVETDSTIAADEQSDKEAVSEMFQALAGMLEQILPAVQSGALTKDFAKSVILFGLRRFRISKEMEEAVEKLFEGEMPPSQQQLEQLQKAQQDIQQQSRGLKDQQGQLDQSQIKLDSDQAVFEANKRAASAELAAQQTQVTAHGKITEAKINSSVQSKLIKPEQLNAETPSPEQMEQMRDERMHQTLGTVMGQFSQGLALLMEQLRAPKIATPTPDGRITIHTETVQ